MQGIARYIYSTSVLTRSTLVPQTSTHGLRSCHQSIEEDTRTCSRSRYSRMYRRFRMGCYRMEVAAVLQCNLFILCATNKHTSESNYSICRQNYNNWRSLLARMERSSDNSWINQSIYHLSTHAQQYCGMSSWYIQHFSHSSTRA